MASTTNNDNVPSGETMIYVTFDQNGKCDSVTETGFDIDLTTLPVTAYQVPARHTRYELVNGQPVELPTLPDEVAATWEQIRDKRNEIELMPITLDDGRIFDYDKDAMDRFDRAIASFDSLPTLVDGKLGWKLFDNSIEWMTSTQLTAVRDELVSKQAVRAAVIFQQAEILATQSKTLDEINDLATWGI